MGHQGIQCRIFLGLVTGMLAGGCGGSEGSGSACDTQDDCVSTGQLGSGGPASGSTAAAATSTGEVATSTAETGVSTVADDTGPVETSGVDTDPKVDTDDGPVLAFPGAVGYGKDTVGGRGGQVLHVTSLDDSGPGTLREALATEGPRTIIFRVSGVIALDSTIRIEHPNVTIAGQSAPGGGIALRHSGVSGFGAPLVDVTASEVIVRHLRLRRGPAPRASVAGTR